MDSLTPRLHFNVKRKPTNLRYPTPKSCKLFHVLIVAKKNVKNGKNNLDKKNKRKMSIIYANSKSYLSRPGERWIMIIEEGIIIKDGNPPLVVFRVVVLVHNHKATPITACWKNKLTFRPKNWPWNIWEKIIEAMIVVMISVRKSLLFTSLYIHL